MITINEKPKNICIIGLGGVGGYFGGLMAYYAGQHCQDETKIFFIARGMHLEMIRKQGLSLNLDNKKTLSCNPFFATDNIEELPGIDVFFLCTKSNDLDRITVSLKNKIQTNTIIIPLLNGIDIDRRVGNILQKGIILPGCVYITSYKDSKPGIINQYGIPGRMIIGYDPAHPGIYPGPLLNYLEQAGIICQWVDDPYPLIWEKYILICAFALVTACYNTCLVEILESNTLKTEFINIMKEVLLIGRKKGIQLADNVMDNIINTLKKYPDNTQSSFQKDILANKSEHEGELYGTAMLILGKELSVPTPAIKSIVTKLKTRYPNYGQG